MTVGAARKELRRHAAALLLLSLAPVLNGCSTLRVPSGYADAGTPGGARATVEGVTLSVKPIVGREAYWELFDEDLPRLGLAAAWVTIQSSTGEAITIRPERWSLRSGGRRYPALRPGAVMDRYHHGSRARLYPLQADRDARARLERICLQPGPVIAGAERGGFVFFSVDSASADSWSREATLTAHYTAIGKKRKVAIEVPLYAHP
jgi:hypothetical protein